MESLRRIRILIWKELLAILKDKRSRFTVFVPPLIQTLVFGYAATYDLERVHYAVYDEDRSEASRQLLARFDGSGVFVRMADLTNEKGIAPLIDSKQVLLVVRIKDDFERTLLSGQTAAVQVLADGRNSNTAATALNYINTIVETFNADWTTAHNGQSPPLLPISRAWYNPNLETRWYMIPGMIAMLTLVQMIVITSMSVAREREQGTLDQLLVTPFRPFEIMVGKSLPSILIGLIQTTGVLAIALLWFNIPFQGNPATLYFGIMLFLLASVGFGLMISSVSDTMQQALLGGFLSIMPFAMLSGLNTPISNMPKSIQYVTYLNPMRYAISLTHRVFLEGASLRDILPDLWPMAIIAAISLTVAASMFRRHVA
mgnify:FL=1